MRLRRYLGERRQARRHPCVDRRAPRPNRSQPQDSANPGVPLFNATGRRPQLAPGPRCDSTETLCFFTTYTTWSNLLSHSCWSATICSFWSSTTSGADTTSALLVATCPGRRKLRRRPPARLRRCRARGVVSRVRYADRADRHAVSLAVSLQLLVTCDNSTPQLTARLLNLVTRFSVFLSTFL